MGGYPNKSLQKISDIPKGLYQDGWTDNPSLRRAQFESVLNILEFQVIIF